MASTKFQRESLIRAVLAHKKDTHKDAAIHVHLYFWIQSLKRSPLLPLCASVTEGVGRPPLGALERKISVKMEAVLP